MTNYEKARAIFEWSVTNNEYDHDALNSSRPIQENTCFYLEGVFERRLAVCDGLSKSYVLLCQMEGLDVIRGVGFGKTGGHAWAYYRNNPNEPYYLICPTWGEGSYIIKNKDNTQTLRSFVSYDAFMTGGDYFYEQTKTLEPPSVYDDLINKDVNIASKKKYDPSIYTLDKLPGYTDYDYQIDTKDEFVAMVKEAYKVCDSRFSLSFMFGNPSLDGQMKAMLDEAGTDWNKYRLSIVPSTLYEATSYTLFFMD